MKCLHCQKPLDSDYCTTEDCLLANVPQWEQYDRLTAIDLRRQGIVRMAIDSVHHIISQSTASEETNFLYAMVAKALIESALNPFSMTLLKYDLAHRKDLIK